MRCSDHNSTPPTSRALAPTQVFRGFVDWGDKDLYEFELNCKSIAQNLASIRGLPDLKMLGLQRNVLLWDGEMLGQVSSYGGAGYGWVASSSLLVGVVGACTTTLAPARCWARCTRSPGATLSTTGFQIAVAGSRLARAVLRFHAPPHPRAPRLPPHTRAPPVHTQWLDALGLGSLAPSFAAHNVDGGTVFLLTEEHLRDLGFTLVGDRLYFIEARRSLAA